MRAERDGRHISGAERLLPLDDLESASLAMLQRALTHPRGQAQRVSFRIEPINAEKIVRTKLLDLKNNPVATWQQGRRVATQLLSLCGVPTAIAEQAVATLSAGAAGQGNSLRGAMLVDVATGCRLEPDQQRGVRASRMDLSAQARQQLEQQLQAVGLNNPHVIEALTLATKVALAPTVVAELCWSDDPDYQAGYVASKRFGYQRISLLKPGGEERGGRVFFVQENCAEVGDLIDWLQSVPVLIDELGSICISAK